MDDQATPTTLTFGLFAQAADDELIDGPPAESAAEHSAEHAAGPPEEYRPTGVLLVEAFADALRLPDRDVRWRAEDALNRLGPAVADGLRASADRVATSDTHRRAIIEGVEVLNECRTGSSVADRPTRGGLAESGLGALTAMLLSGDEPLALRTVMVVRRGFPQLVLGVRSVNPAPPTWRWRASARRDSRVDGWGVLVAAKMTGC